MIAPLVAAMFLAVFPAVHLSQDSATPARAVSAETLVAARDLITAGKPRDAIALLEPLDRSVVEVTRLLGVAHYHADNHQRAIELLLPVRDKLPAESVERRELVQILGLSYYLTGRFADAVPLLEETRAWSALLAVRAYATSPWLGGWRVDQGTAWIGRGNRSRLRGAGDRLRASGDRPAVGRALTSVAP